VTSTDDEIEFGPVARTDGDALCALFARADVRCHCRYWHFPGDKNAWLARCASAPEENALELRQALAGAADLPQGVVARRGREIVAWMKLVPAEQVSKIYEQRLYKNLPCFATNRAGVYTIGCFLVEPELRRRGLADGLVAAGVELARTAGATAIEAFPRRGEHLAEEEQWTGPFQAFARAGFAVVHDFGPYPVLRLAL
jgi:GNAT superfamily N-acetyltransferase